MHGDARQGSEHAELLGRELLEGSSFEDDSLLARVLWEELAQRRPHPGERLGGREGRRFEILETLGAGAMGQVFRARDAELQREVALKFLLPREGLTEVALVEARAIARLDHENIVRIFDVGEWSGEPGAPRLPFLVMEYLEGESLAALLARERPGLRRALKILEAIATGLAHAHERHLIHRDLKPSNVFLTRQGRVKLLDFGLAHLLASAARAPSLPPAGTPAYMAPEQWRGEAQDERTDVWAVGVMLYELLMGRLPYEGGALEQLRAQVTSAEPIPPVRSHRPELPQELEAFLAMALAKDPARRFRTARELQEELRELEARLGFVREAPRASAPQRRQVTLMACQLTGLAGLGEPLDAEELGELEGAFHQGCEEVIRQQGGAVALYMGGELLACFGHLQAREDDSERAVRAGLHLSRGFQEILRQRVPRLAQAGLAVRAGIQTDLMTLDARAPDLRGRALALPGDAPRVAAWLAKQAGPGEVLLGDMTWRLVRGAFKAEPLGPRAFEGLSGAVSLGVHRVLRERRAAVRFDRALVAGGLTPLVGRERELRWLLGLWEQARRGEGGYVLVQGEAGIGKSRLIRELVQRVSPESFSWLEFQCRSQFGAQAFHPVIEVLRRMFRFAPEWTPAQHLQELEERLGVLGLSRVQAHLMGQLLSLPLPEDSPVHLLTPERQKEETFEAMVALLLLVSRARPVLITTEDLHWADSTKLEFLEVVLERIAGARILCVFSARPEFQPTWPRRPWFHALQLERLPAGSAGDMVKEVAQGRALSEGALQQLVRRTDGIPLFIEELTRMVLEGGALPRSVPATLHELLLARLDMLPSRQKSLAQLCAALGREFSEALLVALEGHEEAALRRGLAGLMEAGLLQAQEEAAEPGYRFRHALFQEVAYQSLCRGTRRQYHLRIARVLAEHFPEVERTQPEVLAHHRTEAGEVEQAISLWVRAGVLATQRMANREAVSHFSQARRLLFSLPETSRRGHDELKTLMAFGMPLMQEGLLPTEKT
jgi:class 3 adenylate cyclase